ncbi:MAG: hypothetical protein R6V67_09615 [Spirochaetia bacterium]
MKNEGKSFASVFRSQFYILLIFTTVVFPVHAEEAEKNSKGETEELKVEVIDLYAGIPIIDAGENRGLRVGDELVVSRDSGDASVKGAPALAMVTRTDRSVSETAVWYGTDKIKEGTQLRRNPKIGFEASLYSRYTQSALKSVTIGNEEDSHKDVLSFGVRAAVTRGFYSLRPVVGLEFPRRLNSSSESGDFPFRFYGGSELLWHFRRLRIIPSAAVGIGARFPESGEKFLSASSYGGVCGIAFSYLIFRDIHLNVELGGAAWKSIKNDIPDEIGLFAGLGFGIRG